ncbi:hypothetical protein [Chachezhania sediminis]|uniref:hypothetical protein n=1 Tax=Chachezhania sediminis TaxID=2599291 RepID=UPI00131BD928|nr:hypothetical protein [Chachezhania sediminis]
MSIPRVFLLALLALTVSSCGRPLTPSEKAFATSLYGDQLNTKRVRLATGAPVDSVTFRRPPRPRVTCRERIFPPPTSDIVTTSPAAVTLFNKVLFADTWYLPNYMPDYPNRMYLVEAMLFGHEMVHVWQWQNRKRTGYHPLKAAMEHQESSDPYLFDVASDEGFLSFGYEQQGAIVEEYICCSAIDPKGKRTKRLHEMLAGAFPVSDLPQSRQSDVYLPWKEADLKGICD